MQIVYKNGRQKVSIDVPDEDGQVVLGIWKEENGHYRKDARRKNELDKYGNRKLVHIGDNWQIADTESDPAALYEKKELSETLQKSIQKLPNEQRELIAALFFDGMTSKEYALRVKKDKMYISRLLKKTLKDLRNNFE